MVEFFRVLVAIIGRPQLIVHDSSQDFWLNEAYGSNTSSPVQPSGGCKTGPQGQVIQCFNWTQAAAVINMPTVCPPWGPEGAAEASFRTQQWAALRGSRYVLWSVEDLGIWYLPCEFINCAVVAKSGLIDGVSVATICLAPVVLTTCIVRAPWTVGTRWLLAKCRWSLCSGKNDWMMLSHPLRPR